MPSGKRKFVRILQLIRKHMEGAPRPRSNAAPPALIAASPAFDFDAAASMAAEEQADGDNQEALPLVEVLAAELEAMLADPRAQALSILRP